MATLIHVNSNLLRQPCLFDDLCDVVGDDKAPKLGGQVGRLARDFILYAAWNKAPLVLLHVPEFCAMFGYDRNVLLRKCTAAQRREMLACRLPPDYLDAYSNFLGYTLVKMSSYNFKWKQRKGDSRDKSLRSAQIVTEIEAPHVRRKRGTFVRFAVSKDMVVMGQDVKTLHYQDICVEDYLSLRTAKGYAWDAARTLYMRAAWKRGWWDAPKVTKEDWPSRDDYQDLVDAAGLTKITPLRNQASKLLAMLRKVGQLPSVCMVPQLHLSKGRYLVTWTRYELWTVGGPPKNLEYECMPAPESWGSDPHPPSSFYQADDDAPRASYAWKPGAPAALALVATSARAPEPADRAVVQLVGAEWHEARHELTSKQNSLRWLQSDEADKYYQQRPADEHERHLAEAQQTVNELLSLLGMQ